MVVRLLCLCLALAASTSAKADDEIGAKICPLLKTIAADMEGKAAFYVQGNVLGAITGAYDPDFQKLREEVKLIDEQTARQCPAERTAILGKLEMSSIEEALR